MNRKERRAKRPKSSDSSRFYQTVPPDVRNLIDAMAQITKGKPWFAAYSAALDLREMFGKTAGSMMENEHAATEDNFRITVAALIECLNGPPRKCDDPFQAALYLQSARKDHWRAAKRYEKAAGGPAGAQRRMDEWADQHEDELDGLNTGVVIKGGNYEGGGPKTLGERLDEWTDRTRERFEADGKIVPLAAGFDHLGNGQILYTDAFHTEEAKTEFLMNAAQQLDGRELHQRLWVCEAWVGDMPNPLITAAPIIAPSKSDEHQKAVLIYVSDGDRVVMNMLEIERDRQTGKARLSDPDYKDDALDQLSGAMTAFLGLADSSQ